MLRVRCSVSNKKGSDGTQLVVLRALKRTRVKPLRLSPRTRTRYQRLSTELVVSSEGNVLLYCGIARGHVADGCYVPFKGQQPSYKMEATRPDLRPGQAEGRGTCNRRKPTRPQREATGGKDSDPVRFLCRNRFLLPGRF